MSLREFTWDRKFVVTGGALFLALLLFVFFPGTDRLPIGMQSIIAFVIFFLLFPLFYAKFILGEGWESVGFRMDPSLSSSIGVVLSVVVGFTIFFFGYQFWPALHEAYRLPFVIERSFLAFVRYELFLLAILFFYEVFFRGFVQLLFLRRFGFWSVFFQWGIFLSFLFASQSFGMDQVAMILFAPLSGWVAYRSQSIWLSFFASGLFFIAVDVFLLLANR
jgi:membrane protease YdiL (CAAX protease family)